MAAAPGPDPAPAVRGGGGLDQHPERVPAPGAHVPPHLGGRGHRYGDLSRPVRGPYGRPEGARLEQRYHPEFGEQGTPLPDHPVLITFDDGYTSNLELAAPILERHGLNAVIFVIGINAGQSVYAHSGQPLDPPRFALKDVRPYLESGVLEVESHTFDLHQRADYGYSGREGVLPLAGEPEDAYRQVLAGDCRQARQLFAQELGQQVTALAYPFGLVSQEADRIFGEEGIKVTVTSVFGPNQIRGGDPASLRMLNRYAITDNTSTQELLDLVNWHKETFWEKVLRHLGLEP